MMKHITAIFIITLFSAAFSETSAKKQPKTKTTDTQPASTKNTFAEKTKSCKLYDGLFPMYQDTASGALYMVVKKSQLRQTFIYFSYTENGVVGAGHNRGSFKDNMVFTIERYFDKIEFIRKNTNFYFDPNNAISKAADANISNAVLVSQKIIAEQGENILLDGNAIFLNENISQIKPTPPPSAPGSQPSNNLLGNLSKEKTKLVKLRNYTNNTDIIVDYVYENPAPRSGGIDIADARYITITYQHSFIKAPENIMPARPDDQRIGYFAQQINDMTTTEAVPYKDVINRWRLEKKEKGSALSEPIKPITWWIEKTTPHEIRPLIKEAGLQWNIAFEKAGFKNAIVINEQPDTATWDAGDIDYNVLRWTSSPYPPFGGYGPSFVDPRSGEILGADIMLEFVFLTNRINQEFLFDATPSSFDNFGSNNPFSCSAGHHLHLSALFGKQVAELRGLNDFEKRDYMRQALFYLIMHEMGHTLGLMHNMKASQLWSPAEINNKLLTGQYGLTASVMDYPAVNLSNDKTKQGDYFTTKPGPYDIWAIEYGYSEALDDPEKEKERLQAILSRSTDPKLIFGNDADDMRSPGKGVDPRVNINDLTNDVISYSIDRIKIINQVIAKLPEKYKGRSNQELKQAYNICVTEWMNATQAISRYIGGVYINRSMDGKPAYTPVPLPEQKRAMQALSQYLLSPASVAGNQQLYQNLQNQRRGFNFFGTPDDPKIHDKVLSVQTMAIAHLLAPTTLRRITDSRLYGNKYSVTEMLNDLTNACFREDLNTKVSTFRQNLQIEYVKSLCSVMKQANSTQYDNIAKSAVLYQIKQIKNMMLSTPVSDVEMKAHREHITFLIDEVLAKPKG